MEQWMLAICAAVFTGSTVASLMGGKLLVKSVTGQRIRQVRGMLRRNVSDEQKMKEPFFERIIVPLLDVMIHRVAIIIPLNENARERLDKQLLMAGSRVRAKEYTAMTMIMIVCMIIAGPQIVNALTGKSLPVVGGMALFAFAGFVMRRFSLTSTITKRKMAMEGQLPNVIDLLSVSVTAGLGFEQALSYVTERCEGVLVDEFRLLQQQLLMGRSKKEAMRGLAERCDIDEVATFVSSVLQAEEVGISMQNILNSQSDAIRQGHKQKVEEKAAKLPVKILLPIVLFVFPVIFIVLMGPAVITLMQTLAGG